MLDSRAEMRLLDLAFPLALGLVCGSLAVALLGSRIARRARSRRNRAGWFAAAALCRNALPFWTALALPVALVARPDPCAFALAALVGVGCVGAQLLLGAGWIESRGRVKTGGALGRIGGQLLFVGAVAFAGAAAVTHRSASVPMALAGATALLAGLSGKPRPSGTAAVVLYGIGLVLFATL